jgi:hypothetical protein
MPAHGVLLRSLCVDGSTLMTSHRSLRQAARNELARGERARRRAHRQREAHQPCATRHADDEASRRGSQQWRRSPAAVAMAAGPPRQHALAWVATSEQHTAEQQRRQETQQTATAPALGGTADEHDQRDRDRGDRPAADGPCSQGSRTLPRHVGPGVIPAPADDPKGTKPACTKPGA